MYCEHFGLRCMPFEDRADPNFLFATEAGKETLAALEYELHYGKGLVLLAGDAGVGKTLLVRSLLMRLPATDHAVVVVCPQDGMQDPIRETCKGFGVSLPTSQDRDRTISRLRRHLERNRRAEHRSILIIDQAENLSEDALRQIISIADLEQDDTRLIGPCACRTARVCRASRQGGICTFSPTAFRCAGPTRPNSQRDTGLHRAPPSYRGQRNG